MLEWIPIILIIQGGMKIAEIEGTPEPSYYECTRYGEVLAQDYMYSWMEANGADRNDIPMLTLKCKESNNAA